MSYANFLAQAIALGHAIRTYWPLILAIYNAIADFQAAQGKSEEGTLQLVSATDDELHAEQRLAELIDGDAPSVSLPGRFRQVYQLLKAFGLLDKLFGKVLGS